MSDDAPDGRDQEPTEPAGKREPTGPPPASRVPVTQMVGRLVLAVLALLFVAFAAANAQHVDFSWIVGETEVAHDAAGERVDGGVRMIVLLLAALVVGILMGLLLAWQGRRTRRRPRHGPEA